MPSGPRRVCLRFVDASSLAERKKYTSINFWPALTAMSTRKDNPDFTGRCDLTNEGKFSREIHSYSVCYQLYGKQKGEDSFVVGGFFYLKNSEETWKIVDIFAASVNNKQLPEPVSIAANYQTLFPAEQQSVIESQLASPKITAKNAEGLSSRLKCLYEDTNWGEIFLHGAEHGVAHAVEDRLKPTETLTKAVASEERAVTAEAKGLSGLLKGLEKGLVAFFCLIAAGLAALVRYLFGDAKVTSEKIDEHTQS